MTRPAIPATLTELLGGRAARDPDAPYFDLYDETVAFGRLWQESARYAADLAKFGVERGDKVCLIYPTCAEFFYTFFGALRLGAVPVPLYPTLGAEATANVLRDSDAGPYHVVPPPSGGPMPMPEARRSNLSDLMPRSD